MINSACRCITNASLVVLERRRSTTMLSELKHMHFPVHCSPHSAAAITTGSSSLAVMWVSLHLSGHCTWNQPYGIEKPPHPKQPEASDVTCIDATGAGKKDLPFPSLKNIPHHLISALALRFRRRLWHGAEARDRSENKLRRKVRPCGITVAACERWPSKDSSSFLVHDFFPIHACIRVTRLASLSEGRRNSNLWVSIRIPRNTRDVVGPSVLFAATGIPTKWRVSRAVERVAYPWEEKL